MGHDYIQVHVYYIIIFTHSTRLSNDINVYQINFRFNLGLFGIHLVVTMLYKPIKLWWKKSLFQKTIIIDFW